MIHIPKLVTCLVANSDSRLAGRFSDDEVVEQTNEEDESFETKAAPRTTCHADAAAETPSLTEDVPITLFMDSLISLKSALISSSYDDDDDDAGPRTPLAEQLLLGLAVAVDRRRRASSSLTSSTRSSSMACFSRLRSLIN